MADSGKKSHKARYLDMSNSELRKLVLKAAVPMDELTIKPWFEINHAIDRRTFKQAGFNVYVRDYADSILTAIEWYIMPLEGAHESTMAKIISRCYQWQTEDEIEEIIAFHLQLTGFEIEKTTFSKFGKLTVQFFWKTLESIKFGKLLNSKRAAINAENKAISQGNGAVVISGENGKNEQFPQSGISGENGKNEQFPQNFWDGENGIITNKQINNNLETTTTIAISKGLESVVGWLNENGKKHNEHDLQQLEEYLQAGFTLEAILYRLKYSLQNARMDFWKLLYKILQEDKAKQLFTPEAMQQSDKAHSQRVNRGEAAAAGGYNEAEEMSKAKIYKPKEYCALSDDLPESKQQEPLEALLEKVINSAYSAVRGMPRPKQNAETIAVECKRAFQAYNQPGQGFIYSDIGKQAEVEVKKQLESEGK